MEILETCEKDLGDVQRLWADGDVMRYVGFPEGLRQSNEEMGRWYEWIRRSRPRANHYSVFEDGTYCGETFYRIDEKRGNSAAVDIKLFAFACARAWDCRAGALVCDGGGFPAGGVEGVGRSQSAERKGDPAV